MSDETIKAAVQEILEILRKHDLSAFFTLAGRTSCETRWRFASWSCFEQEPHKEGSIVHFRTRKGGNGDRRSEKDIQDSVTVAYSFATELGPAGLSAFGTWKELEAKMGAEGWQQHRGAPPPWDLK